MKETNTNNNNNTNSNTNINSKEIDFEFDLTENEINEFLNNNNNSFDNEYSEFNEFSEDNNNSTNNNNSNNIIQAHVNPIAEHITLSSPPLDIYDSIKQITGLDIKKTTKNSNSSSKKKTNNKSSSKTLSLSSSNNNNSLIFDLNQFSDKLSTKKGHVRLLPLMEHEIRHVVFNVPNINTNKQASEYLNVSYARWKKFASLYKFSNPNLSYDELINSPYYNKSYFQILLDKVNAVKKKRIFVIREVYRKKKFNDWYYNYLINKLNNTKFIDINGNIIQAHENAEKIVPFNIKEFTTLKLKNFLIDNEILPARCNCCGYNEKNLVTNRVPLLIDHINSNFYDFSIVNLQFLCFNCFYQLVGNPYNYYKSPKDYD